MRLFKNYSELKAALDLPVDDKLAFRFLPSFYPAKFTCSCCGESIDLIAEGSIIPNYGIDKEGNMLCFKCCEHKEKVSLLDRSKPFSAYLSNDRFNVTTFTGAKLGKVFNLKCHRTGFNRSKQYYFTVCDIYGNWWKCRGAGEGMYCTMRPMKNIYLKKNQSWFFFEVTDTYGGEANYSWVRRYKVSASSLRGAVSKVASDCGYSGRVRRVMDAGDFMRWNVQGAAICIFGSEYVNESEHFYLKTI